MGEESKQLQSRKWTATLWLHQAHNCLEETMKNLTDTGRVRFIAYGQEVCPETGTLHYQTYLVCPKPTRLSQLIKWLGDGHHFEPMYGTLGQNETYCSKEGSFIKLGDEPKQGERNDIHGFVDCLRAQGRHARPTDVALDNRIHEGTYVKYHAGLEKLAHALREREMRTDRTVPNVYIRIGESGSGKTKWLDDTFGLSGWARMPSPTSTWWITPTVSYSDTVLIDDVSVEKVPKVVEFLEWTDRYPLEFNSKGGHLWWKPKNIVITSNQAWTEWWPKLAAEHRVAVGRRVTRISLVFKDRLEEHFYPNGEDGVQQEVRQEEVHAQAEQV